MKIFTFVRSLWEKLSAGGNILIDRAELDKVISYLQQNNKIECNPYPVYPEEVYQALGALKVDANYQANYRKLAGRASGTMNKKELATMLTFISRGERLCDGHIAGYVESGELLQLMLRLRELM